MTTHEQINYRNILVPLDGSEFARAAMPTARALAEAFDARLQAISVGRDDNEVARLRMRMADVVDPATLDDHLFVTVGDVVPAIQRRAMELQPCLVCLSTHGRGRVVGAVIGSVARSLLHAAAEPIVVVGPLADRPPGLVGKGTSRRPPSSWVAPSASRRIVACVDGSTESELVLPAAAEWARTLALAMTILTVAEDVPPPLDTGTDASRRFGPDGDADAYIARLVDTWRSAVPNLDGRVVYDPISPASGVRTHLGEHPAGLLAVTTHARSGWSRVRFGAAAASIVHASVAPVLVVPLKAPRDPSPTGTHRAAPDTH